MAIQNQIERIEAARNDIRNKLVELALVESSAKIDELAAAVKGIHNCGDVDVEVQEGQTFTIPAGYHNGSGTVKGVAGGGNYTLQAKSVVPTKEQQSVTPDEGKYGLSSVTVGAIPEAYQDVTSVTAGAADVLTGKVIVDATGKVVAGSMTNNGEVNDVLHIGNPGFTIPKGYHSGGGSITIQPESKTVTPTESQQIIAASAGKVLDTVTIEPIPDNYENTDGVNTAADKILSGQEVITSAGKITGTMPNNGKVDMTLTTQATEVSYTIPAGYHDGMGVVSIIPEAKTATPTKSKQKIVASEGKVLSIVDVDPIPDAYQDVTGVTATDNKVLVGSSFVDSEGNLVEGIMINHGAVSKSLDSKSGNQSYTIPEGYHNGSGKITISVEVKEVTPTKKSQSIAPTSGKVLAGVTVKAIPDAYQDVTGVTATASAVLEGHDFVDSTGAIVEGTMINRGKVTQTIDGLATTSYIIPQGYHDGTGTISLTNDIETLLAAI